MISKISKITFVCLLQLLAASVCIAAKETEETLYDVEILIFEHAASANSNEQQTPEERWPENPGFPRFKSSKELLTPIESLTETDALKPDDFYAEPIEESPEDLSDYAQKIENSNQFNLLIYKKWRQPLLKASKTLPVYVSDLSKEYLLQVFSPEDFPQTAQDQEQSPTSAEQELLNNLLAEEKLLNQPIRKEPKNISEYDPIIPFDELDINRSEILLSSEEIGPPNHRVFGLFSAFKSRFPHLSFDVFYKNKSIELATETTAVTESASENAFPMTPVGSPEPVEGGLENGMEIRTDSMETITDSKETSVEIVEQEIIEQIKKPISAIRLSESSRIRLNELHYFDHPKFGVIARIKKYEPPEDTTESSD